MANRAALPSDEAGLLYAVLSRQTLPSRVQPARLRKMAGMTTAQDEFTGLLRRQTWVEKFEALDPKGGALLLVDIDHFKSFNDELGYEAGDKVLRRLGRVLETCAPGLLSGRQGGDELLVYVPNEGEAPGLAERVRAAVEQEPMFVSLRSKMVGRYKPVLTVSVAIAAVRPGAKVQDLWNDLDQVLCRAKNAGRNRVEQSARS